MDWEFMLGIFCVSYMSLLMYTGTASKSAEPVTQTEAEDHGDSAFTYWMLEEMEG
jgi:hypothetical protein